MVKKTVEQILKEGVQLIEERDYNNPFLDVQIILAYLIKKDRIYLHIHKDEIVKKDVEEEYFEMIKKRNIGYPLQYMINKQEFMGLNFYVEEGILIPRPDTEILVEKIINIVKDKFINKEVSILDIGTGSGAIAVSLAYYLKNSKVTAVDISDQAVKIAAINAEKNEVKNIKIIKGDLFNNLNLESEKFDIIVSNPPYIETDEIEKLQKEVSDFEPKKALDGGKDGLKYYKEIVKKFSQFSNSKSILSMEIGYNQGKAVKDILQNSNLFDNIEIDKDLSVNDRVITGYRNNLRGEQ